MTSDYFFPTDILLPSRSPELFSAVACDQYTSQPDYWNAVKEQTKNAYSAYHLVFPEIDLENDGFENRIQSINEHMNQYLDDHYFSLCPDSMLYVERTLKNGAVRKGLIGMIDLEQYDYQKGAENFIRATEGTVLERIPPRVRIRENAPLELPHVMLLIDDSSQSIIEPLSERTNTMEEVYSFPLMMDSGSIRGYRLSEDTITTITEELSKRANPVYFNQLYHTENRKPMLFAVGDGNHSLATAKACYEKLKQSISSEEARNHPARYALVELVNLHDHSLEFEAIHRILFDVSSEALLKALSKQFEIQAGVIPNAQHFTLVTNHSLCEYSILNPNRNLPVGTLQEFLDDYLEHHGGKIDYIHGEDVVCELCKDSRNTGILLPCMDKSDLFKTVILDGALPRKTFSMGEACDKRFYLEARKIRG